MEMAKKNLKLAVLWEMGMPNAEQGSEESPLMF